jgi:hypothetical protein
MSDDRAEYQGFIDGVFGDRMSGWCWQKGSDRPISVAMLIDNAVVVTFSADLERGDLAHAGIGNGRHGFMTPPVLRNVTPDAVIRMKIVGTEVELLLSGQRLSEYRQLGPVRRPPDPFGTGYIPENTEFNGTSTATLPRVSDIGIFRVSGQANLEVEPTGRMRMPSCRVVNRTPDGYSVVPCAARAADGRFPATLPFPAMKLTILENGFCVPFAPPLLPRQRRFINDYIIPWAPDRVPWFRHGGDNRYFTEANMDMDDVRYEIETGFYMDHSISSHFGHFMGDCLCRMFAWDVVRQIFGDVKLIIAGRDRNNFQAPLLAACGVVDSDVLWLDGLVRCKRLVMATQSLGVEQYASPSSLRLWNRMRDRIARRDISLPDRIYLSRGAVETRKLVNEVEAERIFQSHGLTIVRPETLSVEQQIALVSNALLVAGPAGSGMFNLAFQGRLRSAFILAHEARLQTTEMLFCAGGGSDLWYHLGIGSGPGGQPGWGPWSIDPTTLAGDVADWVAASGEG